MTSKKCVIKSGPDVDLSRDVTSPWETLARFEDCKARVSLLNTPMSTDFAVYNIISGLFAATVHRLIVMPGVMLFPRLFSTDL